MALNTRSIWLLSNNISFGFFNKYQKTQSFISYSVYWDHYVVHGVVFVRNRQVEKLEKNCAEGVSCAITPMGKIVGKAVFLEQKEIHACLWKNKRLWHVTKYWSTL